MPFYSCNKQSKAYRSQTGLSPGPKGYSRSTSHIRFQFTGFMFYWRKTKNKRANLCSMNLSLLFIHFAFFHICTSAFISTSALCREVTGKLESWCWTLAWSWSLILCRSFFFQLALETQGHCGMAPIVWVCLGEAGFFPGLPRLGHTCGPGLIWDLQFCRMGPGRGLASLWSGGGALIQLTHPHCFSPQI